MKLFVGVKGMVFRPDGKFLILKEADAYLDQNQLEPQKWDFVGGRIEPEEKLLDGLRREIKEESGLEVEIGSLLTVRDNFPSIRGEVAHVIRVYYVCHTAIDKVTLSVDHDKFEWIELKDAFNYDFHSEILDVLKDVSPDLKKR